MDPRLKSKKLTKCDSWKLKFHTKPHNNHTQNEKLHVHVKTFSPRDPLSYACMLPIVGAVVLVVVVVVEFIILIGKALQTLLS